MSINRGKSPIFSRETIGEIRSRVDILELMEAHDVHLRPAGSGTFKALCPLPHHDEKTPSFTVYPDSGSFYCYGCGARGDVFDFLREVVSMSFPESVEYLGQRVGVVLEHEVDSSRSAPKAPIAEINAVARDFYVSCGNQRVSEFVYVRGYSQSYLREEWGMGYSGEGLLKLLKSKGYTNEQAVTAGLAFEKNGRYFEAFRGRLMWPIYDTLGRVAGFGARKLYDNDPRNGKFVNTVDTPLYKKSEILFGFNKSRSAINSTKKAILCEGYTDVISYHLAGLPISVATCGTSVTDKHLKKLARILGDNGELTVSMDGDKAGLKSAVALIDIATKHPLNLTAVTFPEGMDPDEYRAKRGAQALKELYEQRRPLIEVAIDVTLSSHNTLSPEGASAAAREANKIIATVHDDVLRERYAEYLAQKLKTTPRRVAEQKPRRIQKPEESTLSWGLLQFAYHFPQTFCSPENIPLTHNMEAVPDTLVRATLERALVEVSGEDPAVWREFILSIIPEKQGANLTRGLPKELLTEGSEVRYLAELRDRLLGDWAQREERKMMLESLESLPENSAKAFLESISTKESEQTPW